MQQMIFIADLIACSTYLGNHYAHHQELESIIQVVAACHIWRFGFQVVGMVWSDHLYNTLELLMMGIVLPEICWACNKICNKYHLLHLVGILFPHNNDDARSISLKIYMHLYYNPPPLYVFFNILLKIYVNFKNNFSYTKILLKLQYAYLAETFNRNKSKSN